MYVLRHWLSNYLRVQRASLTILNIIPRAHVTMQMQTVEVVCNYLVINSGGYMILVGELGQS